MESEIQAVKPTHKFDDHFISILGGLVVGATAWALAFAVVAIFQATTPPGINLLDTITAMKLVPPPGVDLSQITISLPPPDSVLIDQIINIAFVAVPIFIGLFAGWISYRKVLKMD